MATLALFVAVVLAFGAAEAWWRTRLALPPAPRSRRLGTTLLAAAAVVLAAWALLRIPSEGVFLLLVLWLPVHLLLATARWIRHQRLARRSTGPGRILAGNLLLVALTSSLLLAGGELWFRYGHDTTDSIGYTKVAQRWLARHYRHNLAGFRDDVDYEPRIAAGKRRVSFVGDSFTAGHGIADVGRRFANLVRRGHPEWEVHVLARNGADTQGESELLQLLATFGYQFDEVVLVYCLNDVLDVLPGWRAAADAAAAAARRRWAVFDSSWLLDVAYFRVAVHTLPGVGDYFAFVGEGYDGEPWLEQQRRLRALRAVVEQHGGRLRVVTWPFLHRIGPDYPHEAAHARLDAFWRAEGVDHLDLLPVLRGEPPARLVVNAADAHPNEHASALAAAAIDRWLGALSPR